jgi:hypothetical protein
MHYLLLVGGSVFLLAGSLSVTERASACSCHEPGTARERLERVDAVFLGTAIRAWRLPDSLARDSAPAWLGSSVPAHTQVRLAVDTTWKGADTPEVVVYTYPYSESCGVEFVVGHRYLVFAQRAEHNTLVTSYCFGTTLDWKATTDIRDLGTGRVPST